MALRKAGYSIRATADMAGCSQSQVKRIWARLSPLTTDV
ncbi:MAG: helix-turn-helix domain-containing protein [Moraxellaceae bacterium]